MSLLFSVGFVLMIVDFMKQEVWHSWLISLLKTLRHPLGVHMSCECGDLVLHVCRAHMEKTTITTSHKHVPLLLSIVFVAVVVDVMKHEVRPSWLISLQKTMHHPMAVFPSFVVVVSSLFCSVVVSNHCICRHTHCCIRRTLPLCSRSAIS